MSLLPVGIGSSGGYTISRSVRTRSSASAYLNRTPSVSGSASLWTWSGWVKRGSLGSNVALFSAAASASAGTSFRFINDTLDVYRYNGTAYNWRLVTTQLFRDLSAWYHIIIAFDSGQATASDRVKIYVNGTQVTAFSTASYPTTSYAEVNGSGYVHYVSRGYAASEYFDGYQTEINWIDGQALTPSSFGETDTITGVWKPKKYTGTYGTNGFYLNFSDNSATTATTIGKDYSGNGNNWTPNNISVTAGVTYDSMIDVPTLYADGGNGRGNYAVLNPLTRPVGGGGAFTLTNGNLRMAMSYIGADSTIAMSSGKWYWEVQPTAGTASYNPRIGIVPSTHGTYSSTSVGDGSGTYGYASTGQKGSGGIGSAYGASFTDNDVIGVALDMDGGTLTFYKNGVSQGQAYSGISGEFLASAGSGATGGALTLEFNFGQRPFSYTPPTGFKALNTQNLPEPTIKKGNQYFDATTYTGTSASNAVVNASGFQPDLVWLKNRNYGSGTNHVLVDAVRGASLGLASNLTNADFSTSGNFSSINSNGFTVTGTARDYNFLNDTFVGWQWKESASAGFDIVTYTGTGANRTVAHSLGVAPSMVIVKDRTTAGNWPVYHVSIGATNAIYLNLTNASGATSTAWNNTAPTSSVFSLGTSTLLNGSGDNYVAYLFAEVAGFSKFGSYTGNGSADGPFIYCGFRPKFVLYKRTNAVSNWFIDDSSRSGYNVITSDLLAEATNVEASYNGGIDFLSNGFKQKATANGNASGGTYIFMAFAENPFKHSLAR